MENIEKVGLLSYTWGLILSLIFTLGAYFIVTRHLLSGEMVFVAIGALAILQAIIQLLLFLHISKEEKPRFNLVVFFFALLVLLVLVIGSLWIMYNLNYRMMDKM